MDRLVPATFPASSRQRALPRQHRLLAALVGAVVLHAALLHGYQAASSGHAGSGDSEVAGVVHLRLIDLPASKRPAEPEPPNVVAAATTATPESPPTASSTQVQPSPPGGSGEDVFVDARLLSLRPAVLDLVALPQPRPDDHRGPGKALFTLFVDRDGRVVRVRVDSSDLPAEVEDESKQAFFKARFRPGMIDGQAVNARMQVEIVFDAPAVAHRSQSDAASTSLPPPAI